MGQCLSHPGDDKKLKRRPAAPSLSKPGSRRRTKQKQSRQTQTQQQPERERHEGRRPSRRSPPGSYQSSPTTQRVDVQASAEDDPAMVGSRETGSHAIGEREEGGPSPSDCLPEAPQPQRPQDAQENDDQDEDLYSADPQESHEPPAEDLSDDVRKEFCQKLSQLLESKMVEKDQKFVEYKTEGPSSKGILETKKVPAETIYIDSGQSAMKMKADPDESSLLSTAGAGSSMGQTPKETSLYAVQRINCQVLHEHGTLGRGRSGLVRMARWHGAEVALKIFYGHSNTAENEKAMHQETKTLAMLKHPSVVALYGICVGSERPTIVLEYVSGGSLKAQLQKAKRERGRSGGMTARTRTYIAMQAANAMDYLHSQDIIHFDVKAENFLCDLRDQDHPVVKIADVGLSKYNIALYVTSNMRGTLPWMAPELFPQMQRKDTASRPYHGREVNFKVDVYSFGIVLWEIWNLGDDPYPNKTAADVLYRILEGQLRPTIPKDCPSAWSELMQLCWDENPTTRPDFKTISYKLECILKTL